MKHFAANQAPIPLLAPQRRLAGDDGLEAELLAATRRVLTSGRYILGPEISELESRLAASTEASWALLVHSGTDALLMAMEALGIGPGDQVLVPAFSFFASASTVARRGARPRLVDICPGCLCLSPHALPTSHNALTRAILPVHLFGQAAATAPIRAFAKRQQLAIIEDAAQAFGAADCSGQVGTRGDVGCFSFFPSKNLGAFGDGGLLVGHEAALRDRLSSLRVHGSARTYNHQELGGNFRFDALQAALLGPMLTRLAEELDKRAQLASIYLEHLSQSGLAENEPCDCLAARGQQRPPSAAPLGLPTIRSPEVPRGHTFNQFVVRLRPPGLREHVMATLAEQRIDCAIYYPATLAQQPALSYLGEQGQNFPRALLASQQVLALPIAPTLSTSECHRVAETLVGAIASFRHRATRPVTPRAAATGSRAPRGARYRADSSL